MKKALNTLPAVPDDAYQEIMNRIKNGGKYSQGTAFRTLDERTSSPVSPGLGEMTWQDDVSCDVASDVASDVAMQS